ncbi:MAG: chaperonin GroES [Parcubacteria bacterium C7867-001]|nr:MAG: chaperonin GroES [Parcubacteria bacterium C7867-001]
MAKSDTPAFSIIPRGDRVIVKPMKKEEKTASGIIIPDTVKSEKPERGTIVAVGQGRMEDGKLIPMDLKVGDKVLFEQTYRDPIKVDGEEYYIFNEASILAKIK